MKQAIKKSGQGAEGFSATDQWVWDHFQFLVPHIVETERRNVASFKSKLNSVTDSSTSHAAAVVVQSSSEAEGDTHGPNPPPMLPIPVQDETVAIGKYYPFCIIILFLLFIKLEFELFKLSLNHRKQFLNFTLFYSQGPC